MLLTKHEIDFKMKSNNNFLWRLINKKIEKKKSNGKPNIENF